MIEAIAALFFLESGSNAVSGPYADAQGDQVETARMSLDERIRSAHDAGFIRVKDRGTSSANGVAGFDGNLSPQIRPPELRDRIMDFCAVTPALGKAASKSKSDPIGYIEQILQRSRDNNAENIPYNEIAESYLVNGFYDEARAYASQIDDSRGRLVHKLALLADGMALPKERKEHNATACAELDDAISEADRYINGDGAELSEKHLWNITQLPEAVKAPIIASIRTSATSKSDSSAADLLKALIDGNAPLAATGVIQSAGPAVPAVHPGAQSRSEFLDEAANPGAKADEASLSIPADHEMAGDVRGLSRRMSGEDLKGVSKEASGGPIAAPLTRAAAIQRPQSGEWLSSARQMLSVVKQELKGESEAGAAIADSIRAKVVDGSVEERFAAENLFFETFSAISPYLKDEIILVARDAASIGATELLEKISGNERISAHDAKAFEAKARLVSGDFAGAAKSALEALQYNPGSADAERIATSAFASSVSLISDNLDLTGLSLESRASAAWVMEKWPEAAQLYLTMYRLDHRAEDMERAMLATLGAHAEFPSGEIDDIKLSSNGADAVKHMLGGPPQSIAPDGLAAYSAGIESEIDYIKRELTR